jgi:sugar diacid utilization regulator
MDSTGSVVVRDLLPALRRWQARLLAGEAGLANPVTGVVTMRARLPAFDRFAGGEIVLLSLNALRSLAPVSGMTLPGLVRSLAGEQVAAIAVAGLADETSLVAAELTALDQATTLASQHGLPLIALGHVAPLAEAASAMIEEMRRRRERPPSANEQPDRYAERLRASLREEALEALLTGTYAGESQMQERAAQLGHDLARPHVGLRVELEPHAPLDGAAPSVSVSATATQFAEQLTVSLGAWTHAHTNAITALLPVSDAPSAVTELVERVTALLKRGAGDDLPWCAGMGEPAIGPSQARRSATEAGDAARLGMLIFGAGHVARQSDLGVYRLLLSLRDNGELDPFVTQTLAPLEPHTRAGESLVETLEAYFACGGNLSAAARDLHLHRNSLLYRLHRARERLGHDLDDPERRLALEVALKARLVLRLGRG